MNSWLEFGIRWQYGSGFPISQPAGVKPRIILQDQDLDGTPETPVIATRNINPDGDNPVIFDVDFADRKLNSRKPQYHRLDFRINAFADWWDLDWTIYLDVINVYNQSNVIGYDYYVEDNLTLGRETTTYASYNSYAWFQCKVLILIFPLIIIQNNSHKISSMKKSIWLWLIAFFLTIITAVYQRVTGPTYPVSGEVMIDANQIDYKLARSHGGEGDHQIEIEVNDETICGELVWKRYKTNDEWTSVEMIRQDEIN